MSFSKRMGYRSPRIVLQVDDMDGLLITGIWNVLTDIIWRSEHLTHSGSLDSLHDSIWRNFFKKPVDIIPDIFVFKKFVREFFFSSDVQWYDKYDLLEFLINNIEYSDLPDSKFLQKAIISRINTELEREMSGFRVIDMIIAPIVSPVEIAEIEVSLSYDKSFQGISIHINRALDLLSNRNTPDYRNSIKESISAVESMCKVLTENKKATLGEGLKKLESFGVTIHPSLKEAFNKLYGYTSDEKGIRHAIFSEETSTFEEAKFMLVACSAFCNYVISLKNKS